jgi:hypothetical protein
MGAASGMSATLLGFLAALTSTLFLAFLAASDARRLPGRRSAVGGLRRLAIAVAILPGALVSIGGQWVAFMIWLGTTAVLGWAVAATTSMISSRRNSQPTKP